MSVIKRENQVPHHCGNDTPSLVVDNADHVIKAGVSGDRKPSVIFPNIVGYPRR